MACIDQSLVVATHSSSARLSFRTWKLNAVVDELAGYDIVDGNASVPAPRRHQQPAAVQVELDALVRVGDPVEGVHDLRRVADVPAVDARVPARGREQEAPAGRELGLRDAPAVVVPEREQFLALVLGVDAGGARVGAGRVDLGVVRVEVQRADDASLALPGAARLARGARTAVPAGPADVEDADHAVEAAEDARAAGSEGEREGRRELVQVVEGAVGGAQGARVGVPHVHGLVLAAAHEHAARGLGRAHAREPGRVVQRAGLLELQHARRVLVARGAWRWHLEQPQRAVLAGRQHAQRVGGRAHAAREVAAPAELARGAQHARAGGATGGLPGLHGPRRERRELAQRETTERIRGVLEGRGILNASFDVMI